MDWINNVWVVGIVGGVLSGLIVWAITRKVLSKKETGEYAERIRSANRDLIYVLRPGISEGWIPEPLIVRALVAATARSYSVASSDLHSPKELAEELTKQIMDSSFISADTKQKYCEQLAGLHAVEIQSDESAVPITSEEYLAGKAELVSYRARLMNLVSLMLGAMAALTTVLLVFREFGELRSIFSLTFPALAAVLVSLFGVTLSYLQSLHRRQRLEELSRERHRLEERLKASGADDRRFPKTPG